MAQAMVTELTALFERLVADLPAGTAAVRVRHSERDGMTTINIEPTNPASADFGVVVDEVTLFSFGFGRISQWEFPWGAALPQRRKRCPHRNRGDVESCYGGAL